ncbi:MAG TPA: DUF3830 family protein [Gemmatimonadaceae bacterium]|nr:DUF3830 family protein [Gemmatimonadaceae bacterium]
MTTLSITVGGTLTFSARMELERSRLTCQRFARLLPFSARLIQARWSGEAAWIPLGDAASNFVGLPFENQTSHPAPGEILLYPGGLSEAEVLLPYGPTCFASKVGQLAGNHFLTIIDGREQLAELGRRVLWTGAQEIVFAPRHD